MDVASLPKIELHLHLDCSLSYDAARQLVSGLTRSEFDAEYCAPSRCTNLAEFLSKAPKGVMLMQDESALRLVTEDLFRQLQADGVVYAELRFAPLLHTDCGLSAERVMETVCETTERMRKATGVDSRLILCTLRHFSEAQSMHTARLAEAYRGSLVAGLDLAGDEAGYPLGPHVAAFEYARNQGLFRTAHAGEGLGPESVWETLRELEPTRIGHGTRSVEDPALVQYLREQAIHLELCPSSNVQIIPSIADMSEHPIDKLYCAGVRLNVNTDSRMLTRTTLTREYAEVHRVFHWRPQDFLRTNLMAIEASFTDDATKANLRQTMITAYGPLYREPRINA